MKKNQVVVSWFEIVVENLEKSKIFYENIFQVKLESLDNSSGIKMYIFPGYKGKHHGAMGALISGKNLKSGNNSVTIYFECLNLEEELSRVKKNGGKVLIPKTGVGEHGFIAHFLDLEGNKIGLQSIM
ncbi:MAG: VOC family protein [bacterium]|nr:VOC family protein [bacterium]